MTQSKLSNYILTHIATWLLKDEQALVLDMARTLLSIRSLRKSLYMDPVLHKLTEWGKLIVTFNLCKQYKSISIRFDTPITSRIGFNIHCITTTSCRIHILHLDQRLILTTKWSHSYVKYIRKVRFGASTIYLRVKN